jgi:hypothetical protein
MFGVQLEVVKAHACNRLSGTIRETLALILYKQLVHVSSLEAVQLRLLTMMLEKEHDGTQ